MKKNFFWAALVGACLLAAAPARAIDPWDAATEDDNGSFTDNGLTHGTQQVHDLDAEGAGPTADQDWYTLTSSGRSSYEVAGGRDDGRHGPDGAPTWSVSPRGGTTVLQSSRPARGLQRGAPLAEHERGRRDELHPRQRRDLRHRLHPDDQYRIRFFESTYGIPRYNNTGGQITVLNVASMVPFSCIGRFPLLQQRRDLPRHAVEHLLRP